MSPEVLIGHNEATPKIDVWALGCLLYGMITGKLPFRSSDKDIMKKMIIEQQISINRKDFPGVTEECKDLIEKMLDKDPYQRIGIREIFEHSWISKYKNEK
jgi:serine/threonine protein kinase